jgi:hypothetical protein
MTEPEFHRAAEGATPGTLTSPASIRCGGLASRDRQRSRRARSDRQRLGVDVHRFSRRSRASRRCARTRSTRPTSSTAATT